MFVTQITSYKTKTKLILVKSLLGDLLTLAVYVVNKRNVNNFITNGIGNHGQSRNRYFVRDVGAKS